MSTKHLPSNQKALDALPPDSGTWSVEGLRGLYVRARGTSKRFFIQRRVKGRLVRHYLKESSMKEARRRAMEAWAAMKPAPGGGAMTLAQATEAYITADGSRRRPFSDGYKRLLRWLLKKHLADWAERAIVDIGADRIGLVALSQRLKANSLVINNQAMKLLAAVYRWYADVHDDALPNWPKRVAPVMEPKPRDWAYSPDELRAWWHAIRKERDGTVTEFGVSTLGAIKRMWWLAALFTGARRGSIEALRWADVDIDKRTIRFKVAKGDRPYSVPMADKLAELMEDYRKSPDVPPSEWIFPGVRTGGHMKKVRDDLRGTGAAHRMRHTFRTALAQLGASPDQAKMLMGHALQGVSGGYMTSNLVLESLRPITNAVAEHYVKILGWE